MSASTLLKPADPREFDHLGRNLICRSCGGTVCVFEVPRGYLHPDEFVGSCCLRVKESERGPDGEPPL